MLSDGDEVIYNYSRKKPKTKYENRIKWNDQSTWFRKNHEYFIVKLPLKK